jgi:hypothetical protein
MYALNCTATGSIGICASHGQLKMSRQNIGGSGSGGAAVRRRDKSE